MGRGWRLPRSIRIRWWPADLARSYQLDVLAPMLDLLNRAPWSLESVPGCTAWVICSQMPFYVGRLWLLRDLYRTAREEHPIVFPKPGRLVWVGLLAFAIARYLAPILLDNPAGVDACLGSLQADYVACAHVVVVVEYWAQAFVRACLDDADAADDFGPYPAWLRSAKRWLPALLTAVAVLFDVEVVPDDAPSSYVDVLASRGVRLVNRRSFHP